MSSCPYCNSDKGIEFRYLSEYSDSCYSLDFNDPYIYELKGRMFVSECMACGRLILADDYGGQLAPELFDKAETLYPDVLLSNLAIPEEVRVTYENAKRIQNLNSEAFSMSIRKCIEIICKLHSIEKGSLASKLNKLCEQLSLPHIIAEAADSVRLVGNQAAHDIEDIHPVNSQQIDDLFRVLVEYIYVLPSKLRWFKELNSTNNSNEALITKSGRWVIKKGKYREIKP